MTFSWFVNFLSFRWFLLFPAVTLFDISPSLHITRVLYVAEYFPIEFSRDPFTWCMYARPIIISHFDKCKRIDLTRDDPLSIDKVPLIIMTDRGFLLVKRQEHHRPACLRSISPLFVSSVCLTVARNLMVYPHLVQCLFLTSTDKCNDENNDISTYHVSARACGHLWLLTW